MAESVGLKNKTKASLSHLRQQLMMKIRLFSSDLELLAFSPRDFSKKIEDKQNDSEKPQGDKETLKEA